MSQNKEHPVKKHFQYNNDSNTSICNYCSKPRKGKHSSNMMRHLQARHKKYYNDLLPEVVQYSRDKTNKSKKQEVSATFNLEELKKSLVCLVSIDGRAYSAIEDIGMQGILRPIYDACDKAGIQYRINRQNISSFCETYEKQMVERIASEVENKLISIEMDIASVQERYLNTYVYSLTCIESKTH